MTSDHTPDQYVERLCLNPYCPLDSDHTGACPQPDTAPEGPWTVTVVIDVDESVAQGDEADLAHERIIEAFQSTPPTGGWGLDGVSIQVGPLKGAPATPAPADLLCENCGKPMSHHDAMAGCWPGRFTAPADKARQMIEDVTAEHARTWRHPRCTGTLGSRPSWMSPDQYDPCRCDLPTGHDGPHECEHTRADASPTEGNPDE